jgi:fimbrial chaperone protein
MAFRVKFRPFAAMAMGIVAFATLVPAMASEVTPLLIEINDQTRSSSRNAIRVRSTEDSRRAIEIKVFERIFDANGEQTFRPADDQFLILPPQALLEPAAVQVFRFQYLGPSVQQSRNFYFNVRQMPVDLAADRSQISVIVEFAASVNVGPMTGEPDLAVSHSAPQQTEAGPRLVMMVENRGPRHAYLSQKGLRVTTPAGTVVNYTGEELKSLIGDTLVPAGGKRRFEMVVEAATPGTWQVAIPS